MNILTACIPGAIRERLTQSALLRRFLRLASWSIIAFALDKAAMLVIVFLLARILGVADYGRLTLAQGLVNTAQIFVVLGAGTMLARYIPSMREESVSRTVSVINLCALMVLSAASIFTIAGLIGASTIATTVLDLPASSPVTLLMIGWVVLISLNSLLLAVMLSFEKGASMGLVSLVAALLSIALTPLLAMRFGLFGAIAASAAVEAVKSLLLGSLYLRFLAANDASMFTRVRKTDVSLLWQFGLPVFLNSAMWGGGLWLAQFIVKLRDPEGLTAVGVFGFTNNILGAVLMLSGLTNRAALPIQSSLRAQGEHAKLFRMTKMLSLSQFGVSAALGLLIAPFAPFIMENAGPGFANHWPVLLIMISTAVIIAGQNALGNIQLVYDKPYFITITLVPWATIMLTAAFIFAPYGAYALSGSLLAASIVRTAHFLWGVNKLQQSQPFSTKS